MQLITQTHWIQAVTVVKVGRRMRGTTPKRLLARLLMSFADFRFHIYMREHPVLLVITPTRYSTRLIKSFSNPIRMSTS